MSKKTYRFSQYDFSGGLNVKDSNNLVADNQCIDIQNFYFDEKGSITKREGSAKYNATAIDANPIISLFRFYKSSTAFKEALCVSGTNIYKGDDGAGTWTSIQSGLTAEKPCSFAVWQEICYIWNGYDSPMQYDGTAVSSVSGTPPQGKYLVFRKERLYVAGDPNNPNRLYFCNTGDPTTWDTGTNYIDIRSDDGDWITGILPLGDTLVIYKNNSVWALAGTSLSDFFLSMISPDVGCMAPETLVSYQTYHIFYHRRGVFSFNGTERSLLSDKITPRMEDINKDYIESFSGGVYKDQYWISLTKSGETQNDEVYLLDLRFGSWTYFAGLNPGVFSNWDGATDGGEFLYGDSTNGYVWYLNTGTKDDSTIIDAFFYSKYFPVGNPENFKVLRKMFFSTDFVGEGLNFLIDMDWLKGVYGKSITIVSSGAIWDTAVWDTATWAGSETQNIRNPLPAGNVCQYFAIKFFDSKEVVYKIHGFTMEFNLKSKNYH